MPSPRPALARLALSVASLVALALTWPPTDAQLVPWSLLCGLTLGAAAWDGGRAVRAVLASLPAR